MCVFIPASLADETDLPAPSWERVHRRGRCGEKCERRISRYLKPNPRSGIKRAIDDWPFTDDQNSLQITANVNQKSTAGLIEERIDFWRKNLLNATQKRVKILFRQELPHSKSCATPNFRKATWTVENGTLSCSRRGVSLPA